MTIKEWKQNALKHLAGTDAPLAVVHAMLSFVLHKEKAFLISHDREILSDDSAAMLDALLQRRKNGEPLAYITGIKEFYGRDFRVNKYTLIPRPETEHLIEKALEILPHTHISFADLGTGSGCIAVTLAAERHAWQGTAFDISNDALQIAKDNAHTHGVQDRIAFLHADFTGKLPIEPNSLDLLISNPPYISIEEYGNLDSSVKNFEPINALVPGVTGMEHPQSIVSRAVELLKPGGVLLMEHGFRQGDTCRSLCNAVFWDIVETGKDLAGLDRYLYAVKAKNNK